MWKFLLELLSYVCFVCVLYVISYSNHNLDGYFQVNHLRQLFLNPRNSTYTFSEIITIQEYWRWLDVGFVTNLNSDTWYNGDYDNYTNGYLSDKVNRLIGWATMRQLRIRADTCPIKSSLRGMIPHCYEEYSASDEENGRFYPGWSTNQTTQNYSSSINQAFIYQTGDQLGTYIYVGEHATYGSGGYVYEFRDSISNIRNDLSQLHELGWIDKQTRAIIIQLNLYNPSIPIFTSCTILIEILSSSGVFPSAQFEPLDFYVFKSTFQIVCAFIYLTFIIYFMIMEIITFIHRKKSYFRQIWTYFELGIVACSWTSVGIHIWRTNEVARISRLFSETNGNVYINFQLVAYINDTFSFLLGFCCFFGTLKFLRLCRYNRRMALLSNTLQRASRELVSFSFMFSIVFVAFLILFYLHFSAFIWDCSSLLRTAQMLFEILLLKFDASEIESAGSFLGPFYFTLYILFVVFVCINMFVSIINDNFRIVRDDVHRVDNDNQDIFINFLLKLKRWCRNEQSINVIVPLDDKLNVITVAEMSDPLRRLSKKLDRLTIYIDRQYGNQNIRINNS